MGCGFSNEKPESNLRNKDITNILDDTQRSNFLYLLSVSKCISITTKEYDDSLYSHFFCYYKNENIFLTTVEHVASKSIANF